VSSSIVDDSCYSSSLSQSIDSRVFYSNLRRNDNPYSNDSEDQSVSSRDGTLILHQNTSQAENSNSQYYSN
jgi:hypothetical protein